MKNKNGLDLKKKSKEKKMDKIQILYGYVFKMCLEYSTNKQPES